MSVTSEQRANALRLLSVDTVEKAKSGHPGAPMGMAEMAEVLFHEVLKFNPQDPAWGNRDRFVLSNGHASALLYSLLHLTGYDLSIDDLKQFRQLGSKTPGHPEVTDTPGVETTTGPLGQGLANAVGMAMAEKQLAHTFNRDKFNIIDHYTYVFVGDGCLMEGVSHEASALAATWQLDKLICLYDSNDITIDGKASDWCVDDTAARFRAYGWQVIDDIDGHDSNAIAQAIIAAKTNKTQPSLLICNTQIGKGAPNKAGTSGVHGAPLGVEEVAATREELDWQHDPFIIPDTIKQSWDKTDRGAQLQAAWQALLAKYTTAYPDLAAQLQRRLSGALPDNFISHMQDYVAQIKAAPQATRASSHQVIAHIAKALPELIGGSADLTCSNLTDWDDCQAITSSNSYGNYLYYGVREFGMTAINNGIAAHGGFIAFSATFLVFMEYARNAVRMAAIMKLPTIFVYTHDSIGLGEDGPTHQPIEQIANLRLTPNLHTWRPANQVETAVAWTQAVLYQDGPTALILSRQQVQNSDQVTEISLVERGGYIIKACVNPQAVLIATGSEVDLVLAAAAQCNNVQVVSMPCVEVFLQQDEDYQESVLPARITKRIAIEAAHSDYWYKFVGLEGKIIGINNFGASAPANKLFDKFEITIQKIITAVLE
jgi:transketolase